ncbi:MAG: xanthine dehydrogenase family protein molybdopterin-binding subunit [Acidobacteria bacterium]|nr:MAG: xanthine dehydrogenase family protein molybdopterin-binding subunit [Acidobacteriota bacterium]
MSDQQFISRRDFLRVGAGITVFFWFDPAQPQGQRGSSQYPSDFNAYLRINPNGRVTCFVGKIEMGQGAIVALAQLAAEELDVPFDSVDMVMGDTDVCPWDAGTWGSQSIRIFSPYLRAAAAEARGVLIQLAAEQLGAPVEEMEVLNGTIRRTGRPSSSISYAKLAEGKRIERHLEVKPNVKAPSAMKVAGKSPKRPDARDQVTGKVKYAGDIRVPGMLYARILRPTAHGAVLKAVDTTSAGKAAGVRVVREGELVAVLHENIEEAGRALRLIKAEWEIPPPAVDDGSIFDHLLKAAPAGQVVNQTGNLAEGEKLASIVVDQSYLNSYVAHAQMETHTALAEVKEGKFTVWASTQSPFGIKNQIASALGVQPEAVRVITPHVGGGFGGKSAGRQAVEAALLCKATGKPVQVCWTREEAFFYDTFRPAAVVKIRSGADASGKIVMWDFEVYCAGDREAKQFYDVPHQRTVSHGGWGGGQGVHPFATGPWRAPAVNTNTFARESHIDAMAAKLGIDPFEFRMKNLSEPRIKRVLKAVADRFGWTPSTPPSGRGYGLACALYLGTFIAMAAEVGVHRGTGRVQVKRVVCAQDMGLIVNPEGARLQIEGSITMGLGYALTEEVHFKGGRVIDNNFDTYEIPRFSWVPKIEAVLVEAPEEPAQGGGEPPIVCVGAVIANAIYDAVGVRLYHLPMTPERIKAALSGPARTNTD